MTLSYQELARRLIASDPRSIQVDGLAMCAALVYANPACTSTDQAVETAVDIFTTVGQLADEVDRQLAASRAAPAAPPTPPPAPAPITKPDSPAAVAAEKPTEP